MEGNPSFLKRYRRSAKSDLEEQLETFGVEASRTKITEVEFREAVKKLKEERKLIRNVRHLQVIYYNECLSSLLTNSMDHVYI